MTQAPLKLFCMTLALHSKNKRCLCLNVMKVCGLRHCPCRNRQSFGMWTITVFPISTECLVYFFTLCSNTWTYKHIIISMVFFLCVHVCVFVWGSWETVIIFNILYYWPVDGCRAIWLGAKCDTEFSYWQMYFKF